MKNVSLSEFKPADYDSLKNQRKNKGSGKEAVSRLRSPDRFINKSITTSD